MSRTVLLHYHLFKNAGTSLDELLQENFQDRWVTREFSSTENAAAHRAELADWIAAHPSAVAFSSHTAELPPPEVEGVDVIPLVFVRQPVARILSAYSFERAQEPNEWPHALARNTTLRGYVEVRLAMLGDRQCRNFQTSRLARLYPEGEGTELERALRAVEALPFVGIVEHFDSSVDCLRALLLPRFPLFRVRRVVANMQRPPRASFEEMIASLRDEIGSDTFDFIASVNSDDAVVHAAAARRHQSLHDNRSR